MADDLDGIDLSNLLQSYNDDDKRGLKERWEMQLGKLQINQTRALEIMQMESRALHGLLKGTGSRVDIISLKKLSRFLEIPVGEAVNLYLESLKKPHEEQIHTLERRKFIAENFNLKELKNEGVIDDATDLDHVERELVRIFNYDSIFDYRKDVVNPAYSSAKLASDVQVLNYWIEYARKVFRKIQNPIPYDRQALIEYFPTIRWHSMSVEKGIWEVIKVLYRMGITVIYLPKFKKLHIRGATFSVNKKPSIVLSDYKGNYATIWFALLHELHHVLFDWDDILINSYHISDKTDFYTEVEVEDVANQFAKDYLFSDEKVQEVLPHYNNRIFIEEYARLNHVHPSIVYTMIALERDSWGWLQEFLPDINRYLWAVKEINHKMSASEVAKFYNDKIYNLNYEKD
ncbi:ImmA/IrrE family metallo-endopeptidase [Tunicatimonas pelagia]|uniref:ImmA/IrrE family metallo-endopeptidase n=1 Tax=Tunicatimonas pelagia TaxID=931531 RepID=UPI0026659EB8|nr:ImmA/IrrE family metallo-endopeptidase [Tunicatimonas pelagia]WKN42216.1 ImmA/IrrE family metallo-endopeptidase [Tunicatimonas pelagia]WKN45334.1 ImmA/IrrE family metallo-endopeptidase [Tunicatimonas pelagia]